MNERLKELAIKAKLSHANLIWLGNNSELERFAQLVRDDEREACADLVFKMAQLPKYEQVWLPLHHAQAAIRARGDK